MALLAHHKPKRVEYFIFKIVESHHAATLTVLVCVCVRECVCVCVCVCMCVCVVQAELRALVT